MSSSGSVLPSSGTVTPSRGATERIWKACSSLNDGRAIARDAAKRTTTSCSGSHFTFTLGSTSV